MSDSPLELAKEEGRKAARKAASFSGSWPNSQHSYHAALDRAAHAAIEAAVRSLAESAEKKLGEHRDPIFHATWYAIRDWLRSLLLPPYTD